jgi:hypothetical protein
LSIHRRKSTGVLLPFDLRRVARKAQYLPSGDVRVTPEFDSLAFQPAGLDHLKYRPWWAWREGEYARAGAMPEGLQKEARTKTTPAKAVNPLLDRNTAESCRDVMIVPPYHREPEGGRHGAIIALGTQDLNDEYSISKTVKKNRVKPSI